MVTGCLGGPVRHQQGRWQPAVRRIAQGTLLDMTTVLILCNVEQLRGRSGCSGLRCGSRPVALCAGYSKAYCTRVGGGPFPPSWTSKRQAPGHQMSTVGRGVRYGHWSQASLWLFDLAALKRSIIINGVSGLCITKLDVLDGLTGTQAVHRLHVGWQRIDLLPMGRKRWFDAGHP